MPASLVVAVVLALPLDTFDDTADENHCFANSRVGRLLLNSIAERRSR
jgi:hypothetical protein